MAITQKFLDWQQPALHSAAEYLLTAYRQENLLALDHVIVVVPGRLAGRRLQEILLERTQAEQLGFLPPQIVTVGRLPELLYEARQPFANDLEQRLAWVAAIKACDPQVRAKVFPHLPEGDPPEQWLHYGSLLWHLHRELAGDAHDFSSVATAGEQVVGFSERVRWQALHRIGQHYLETLDSLGLWDVQTARLVAIEHQECACDGQIVLVAAVDMNQSLRKMLDQVADQVTALVVAPENWSERFDQYGCLIPEAWQEVPLDIQENQICLTDDASGQADAVLQHIAEYQGKYPTDEITVGVADELLVPHIKRRLEEFELPARWLVGRNISATTPYLLLQILQEYLASRRTEQWAQLVRHPDVYGWLESQGISGDWLTQLDEYRNKHLPPRLGKRWLGARGKYDRIKQAYQQIEQLLSELLGTEPRSLESWAQVLIKVMATIYAGQRLDKEHPAESVTISACSRVAACLEAQQSLPATLLPEVTATQALHLILDQLQNQQIPSPPEPEAIEILGWLELPLDDAPALIVTSCNESFIPKSSVGGLFLPDQLREQLGLDNNRRRYARDKYALQVLSQTREDLLLIAARRDTEGNPRPVSRLLLATDPETLVGRVRRLCAEDPGATQPGAAGGLFSSKKSASEFDVPRPEPLGQPIESMRVTAFADYLKCPYRFYLRHVARLESLDDRAQELDALAFGSLIHDVLKAFGESELKDSTDANQISEFLNTALADYANGKYSSERLASVDVQLRQVQSRLAAFAQWQVDWVKQGWRIVHTEVSGGGADAVLEVDGKPMGLRGRIDRIDVNDAGEAVIFDYKSSSTANKPQNTHIKSGEWIDLQLPLYRRMGRTLGLEGDIRVGYIALPKAIDQVGDLIAPWGESDFEAAEEVARDVVRKVRQEVFWPPADDLRFADEFASICMDQVFERPKYLAEATGQLTPGAP